MNRKVSRTNRNYIIMGLCAILVIMGVGYAAFSSQLKISGTSNIASNFSVKITDIQSNVQSGSASDAQRPSYTDTTATFKTNLVLPGDSMKYDITVANEGNIDAVLESIDVNTGDNDAITFETSGIEKGDTLLKSTTDILTVIVNYNNSVTSQPKNISSTITVTLNYKQYDGVNGGDVTDTLTPADLKTLSITAGDGLYADEYENGRYIYKGANPNNYITFNNETWRIISVEADNTVKLVLNESIGKRQWNSIVNNNWASPSTLNTYLNGEYLQSITNSKNIVTHSWPIGGVTSNNNDLGTQIVAESETTYDGKVGLIAVSEYIRFNTNINQCGTLRLVNNNYNVCTSTNWMHNILDSIDIWTISNSSGSNNVFILSSLGDFFGNFPTGNYDVLPTIYLSSDVILNGDGSFNNPYVIIN